MAAPRPPRRPQVAPGEFPYDTKRTPPAPLLLLRVGLPQTEPATAVAALVDSGADITVLPEGLPETLGLPQIGEVAVHGVGDAVRRVPVYAAELKAAGWREHTKPRSRLDFEVRMGSPGNGRRARS